MDISSSVEGSLLFATIESPRLDAATAVDFKNQMAELLGSGNHNIVIDLAQVTFVDSSGLSAIISLLKTLGQDGNLALASPSGPVESLLKLTRFDRILPIYQSADQARLALAS